MQMAKFRDDALLCVLMAWHGMQLIPGTWTSKLGTRQPEWA